ncbi:MAG: DMT family transporter [Methylobacteriaceae bacterium]|nr:DMT family transporter [Methylobacteriaceae bacterium]
MRLSLSDPAWAARSAVMAMLVAMLIFGSNFALSRWAVRAGLSPYDLVFLRFAVAAPLMLPMFLQHGIARPAGLSWRQAIVLALMSGAPMNLLMTVGVSLAPAAHGAALAPGTVTAVGVVAGAVSAGMLPPPLTRLGLALVVAGLATVAIAGQATGSANVVLGDALFFATGLLWGLYPVLLHRWRVGGMAGAAVCAVLSLAYIPIYLAFLQPRLFGADPWILAGMAVYLGALNSIVGLWLWGYAVRVLGAGGTQLFPPMLPVIGALAAIPILGELPGPIQLIGIALIVAGLALAAYGSWLRSRTATPP